MEEYANYFDPYTFKRGYTNKNNFFNPELGMMKLCNKIKFEKELLNEFLNEIFRRLDEIEDYSLLNQIENCLALLGYDLQIENTDLGDKYSLQYLSSGEIERQNDMSVMRKELNLGYPEVLRHYNEALETYSNGNFKSCIDNCRTAYEKVFSTLDNENGNYLKGILIATGEKIIQNGEELDSRKKIFRYWLDNNKGANRYRMMSTLYSSMSGLGAHGEDSPSQEDALMILRMTEDVFLWLIQKNII
ncbi:hypothetical protein [Caldibacillus thermoamylovorans]|uniref:hypothetical protein n=1 Tax=Caldibacillus thermoamylovorans TaxID=35841 RepID=UPI00203D6B75|nr:hypothetical protein [Caldibacillus thermoamylovorans]MCM3479277.1 hypothetical protein [Caldibacillus thermoamylovorans]